MGRRARRREGASDERDRAILRDEEKVRGKSDAESERERERTIEKERWKSPSQPGQFLQKKKKIGCAPPGHVFLLYSFFRSTEHPWVRHTLEPKILFKNRFPAASDTAPEIQSHSQGRLNANRWHPLSDVWRCCGVARSARFPRSEARQAATFRYSSVIGTRADTRCSTLFFRYRLKVSLSLSLSAARRVERFVQ